jgi:hypothetical protein
MHAVKPVELVARPMTKSNLWESGCAASCAPAHHRHHRHGDAPHWHLAPSHWVASPRAEGEIHDVELAHGEWTVSIQLDEHVIIGRVLLWAKGHALAESCGSFSPKPTTER